MMSGLKKRSLRMFVVCLVFAEINIVHAVSIPVAIEVMIRENAMIIASRKDVRHY
jgi:hypothetical protein